MSYDIISGNICLADREESMERGRFTLPGETGMESIVWDYMDGKLYTHHIHKQMEVLDR